MNGFNLLVLAASLFSGAIASIAGFGIGSLGQKTDDPVAMYLNDIYTVTANLVGIPGISVPCGNPKEGLPIGLQFLGKHFDEQRWCGWRTSTSTAEAAASG